jgi:hypothetical protein
VNDNKLNPPQFYLKMNGPKVGKAKLSVSDLAEIIKRTQQALKRIGQVLYGQESHGKGRKKKDIEQQCELFLVGWEEGSAIAAFELGPQPDQLEIFGFVGDESAKALMAGMEIMAADSYDASRLPTGFDVGVLEAVESLGKVFEHGIDTISFSRDSRDFPEKALYSAKIREKIRTSLGQPALVGHSIKVGRLEVLNGHGGLKGTFWEVDGSRWTCFFKNEHLDILSDAWMHKVKVTGRTIEEEGKEKCIEVDSLFVIDDELSEETGSVGEARSFWHTASLEELAEEQGIMTVADIDEISEYWPVDDDPDDLLAFVLHERGERRRIRAGGDA